MDTYNTEALLLQIEELFERFRNLPQNARVVILEKIRIKLLEEFRDFVIEENDNAQDMIVEIPFSENAEIIQRNDNFILFPSNDENMVTSITLVENTEPCLVQALPAEFDSREPTKPKTKCLRLMCNYCGKRFSRKNLFELHINRHLNERTFECSTCSQQFNVKDDLSKHIKSHSGERNHVCPICHKHLVNNTTLKNHIRVIHQKQEKFFCNKCDYFAFSKSTVKQHIGVKHEKSFKKYACLVCRSVYNSRTLLKVHMRSHTGEKPYSCKLCETSFVSSGRLTNHMNSVHGECKYPCEICPKSFKTIHKLKRHSFIHTRVKPYTCPFCTSYASNTQGNLTKHVKTVHQMNDFSYLKYKRIMRGDMEEVQEEWIENAEQFTNDYLKSLSHEGETLSVDQLREEYLQKKMKGTNQYQELMLNVLNSVE